MLRRIALLRLAPWALPLIGLLLVAGCGSDDGVDVGSPETGTSPEPTETTDLSLRADSGSMQVVLRWSGADPVDIVYALAPDCDWQNYRLCNGGAMIAQAFGGQRVLTVENDGLEANGDYYFVAEANGMRTSVVSARPLFGSADVAPHATLAASGADMRPGEWRYVETANLPSFRVQFCPEDKGSTHALGWTDAFAYDPETQSFWVLGMRDSSEKRLFFMDRDLIWREVRVPVDECQTDRRPFQRLTLVDGYLYWPSSRAVDGDRRARGEMWRAPIQPFLEGREDVHWERFSPGLDIGNMNTAGDFAVEYYPEMGGWVFFGRRSGTSSPTPFSQEGDTAEGAALGKSWYGQLKFFKPGDAAWTFFDRTYSGQYRGRLLYNPVKREMLLAPGGEFGSQPEQDRPQHEWAIVRHSGGNNDLVQYSGQGPVPWVEKLDRQEGEDLTYYGPRYSTLAYNPANGDYLWWDRAREMIWSSTDGKHWDVYEDFFGIGGPLFPDSVSRFQGGGGLFGATGYVQVNAVPGTDLVLFIDPDRGVILHRVHSD